MRLPVLLMLSAVSGAAATAPAHVMQTLRIHPGDRVPSTLVAAPLPADDSERTPLAFAWALDPERPLQPPGVQTAVSRGYSLQVDAAALRRGVALPLTAAEALIQVSPAPGARSLPGSALQLRGATGQPVPVRSAAAQTLLPDGVGVPTGTQVLRTGTHVAGVHALYATPARGRYVVQVMEPLSPLWLELQAPRTTLLAGGTTTVRARLHDDAAAPGARRTGMAGLYGQALLVAPDGRSWPQPLHPDTNGRLQVQVRVPTEGSALPALWELQVFTGAAGVLRDGRVAFAVAQPTARLSGQAAADPLRRRIVLPVQVAAPGRYEVRGTLYATGRDGQPRPVAQGHAAAWVGTPGNTTLVLGFGTVPLPPGFSAPYELRDLQLHDQSRLAPLESRAAPLRF